MFGSGAGQIPSHAIITNAVLRLYSFNRVDVGDSYVTAFPMFTEWTEGTASGTEQADSSCYAARHFRSDGSYAPFPEDTWGYTGQVGTGPVNDVDFYNYDSRRVTDMIDETDEPNWIEFNVIKVVKEWKDGLLDNNGWYFYTNGYWGVSDSYSSEYSTASLRPQLVIDYTVPPLLEDCADVTTYGYNYDADLNEDCTVDINDVALFVDQWLVNGCDGFGLSWCGGADFNWTYEVQLDDFSVFSDDYGKVNDPCDAAFEPNWDFGD